VRNSAAALVVYDIANTASFQSVDKWIKEIRTERGNEIILMIVGNKTDLSERRQVTIEQGEAKAREHGVMFLETSAKAGFNIKALFRKIAHALPALKVDTVHQPAQTVDIQPVTPPSDGVCGSC
jgi:Ras-related protein Rab-6A